MFDIYEMQTNMSGNYSLPITNLPSINAVNAKIKELQTNLGGISSTRMYVVFDQSTNRPLKLVGDSWELK